MLELKAKVEAGQESAQREFALKQAESLATLYKEIQGVTARVATWRKINYVLKVSTKPPSGTDPNSVMAAVAEPVIYADPRNDITNDVVYYLNQYYRATKNPAGTSKASARPSAARRPSPDRIDPDAFRECSEIEVSSRRSVNGMETGTGREGRIPP